MWHCNRFCYCNEKKPNATNTWLQEQILQQTKKTKSTNTWLQEQILQRLDWLPKFLLRRNTWMQYFLVATNECVAIEQYHHSKTTWAYGHITTKCDPLHYIVVATYQIW
jgi:hypothetical protein